MNEKNRQMHIREIIPLVEKKPVLWDHRLELFKHKTETLAAWDEICSSYNEAYAEMSEIDKNNYRDIVIKKWRNVKDSWRKHIIKTIKGHRNHKNYVYDKELMFLKQGMKIRPRQKHKQNRKQKSPTTTETLTDGDELSRQSGVQMKIESLNNTDLDAYDSEALITYDLSNDSEYFKNTETESIGEKTEFIDFEQKLVSSCNNDTKSGVSHKKAVHGKPSFSYSHSTISNPDESEISQSLNPIQEEDRHISFIKGVLPSLRKFNETQVLKFQMGVLQLIQNIQENT